MYCMGVNLYATWIFEFNFVLTSTILVKILGTSHKISLLQSLIQCPPLPPSQCWLNQTPFDHLNIELGGKGDEKVLNVCFHVEILGDMTKTQKFASVPIYFDQDCRSERKCSSVHDYHFHWHVLPQQRTTWGRNKNLWANSEVSNVSTNFLSRNLKHLTFSAIGCAGCN